MEGGETQGPGDKEGKGGHREPSPPREATDSVLAIGPALDFILYGHNLTILLIISNYR